MSLVMYGSGEGFRRWLDNELFRRFGRTASNRGICIKAGLPDNALYRVLTKGERPGASFCARMAAHLNLEVETLERRAGLRPLLEVDSTGKAIGVGALSDDERETVRRACEGVLATLAAPRSG